MKESFDSPGHTLLREDWRKYYLRNPVRFVEEYLGIKLTLFQRILIMLIFWKRGHEK